MKYSLFCVAKIQLLSTLFAAILSLTKMRGFAPEHGHLFTVRLLISHLFKTSKL